MWYRKEKGAFLLDVYKKDGIPATLYPNISYHIGSVDGQFPLKPGSSYPIRKNTIYSLGYIPEYVRTSVHNVHWLKSKSFTSVNGYSIALDKHETFDDFMAGMSGRRRQALARSIRRLNTCLDISYKMYHGTISKELYDYLMSTLKQMIANRFEQRPEDSETLKLWDKIYSSSFDLINSGKASLYVCYDREKPIFLSLNYHFDKILFGYVSSYNIDYGKFSLGQICIYKHVEWCISNGYILFDLGWGDLEYKRWWSNNTYTFRREVTYPKHSLFAFILVLLDGYKTELIAYLISKKVNIYFRKFKSHLKKGKSSKDRVPTPQYTLEDVQPEAVDLMGKTIVSLEDSGIPNSIIYDFLFLSQTKLSNISVYSMDDGKNYIVTGNKMTKKIVYTSK
jgi:hypothetical protein